MTKRLVARFAATTGVVGGSLLTAGAAFASTTPPVPNAGDATKQAASDLSNGLMDGFVGILPYVIPLLVVFTVIGYVIVMLRAKRKA